ncbi:hypothetical protein AAG570_001451 [Ranatra chinensis]|uniref:Uncharacterized protein n=1 Tax=Ranatra chinensis TaxID=642074 RepID=A0ABD0Y8I9_9HEMI
MSGGRRCEGWSAGVQRFLGIDRVSAEVRGYVRMEQGQEAKQRSSLKSVYSSCLGGDGAEEEVGRVTQESTCGCRHPEPVITMDDNFIEIQQFGCDGPVREASVKRSHCDRFCRAGHSDYCTRPEPSLDRHRPLHQDLSGPRARTQDPAQKTSYRFPFRCRKNGKRKGDGARSERKKVWPIVITPSNGNKVSCSFV